VREEGIRALYRGIVPAFLLTSHGAIQVRQSARASWCTMMQIFRRLQFGIYEELKHLLPADRGATSGMLSTFAIGSVSKLAAASATYPYQVLKARMQQRTGTGRAPYSGLWDCATTLYREGGIRILYSGFAANVVRVVPSGAITLMVYERLRPMLQVAFSPPPAGGDSQRAHS
jgi:solute carrier family 25 folate transporter 32